LDRADILRLAQHRIPHGQFIGFRLCRVCFSSFAAVGPYGRALSFGRIKPHCCGVTMICDFVPFRERSAKFLIKLHDFASFFDLNPGQKPHFVADSALNFANATVLVEHTNDSRRL